MKYELFLRRSAPLSDEELATMDQALGDATATLHLERYRDAAARVTGIDLAVEPGVAGGGEALCTLAFTLADGHGLAVYDPQLGQPVTPGAAASIAARYEQTSAFAAGALGSLSDAPRRAGTRASARLWLIVGGVLATLWLASRALTCLAT